MVKITSRRRHENKIECFFNQVKGQKAQGADFYIKFSSFFVWCLDKQTNKKAPSPH